MTGFVIIIEPFHAKEDIVQDCEILLYRTRPDQSTEISKWENVFGPANTKQIRVKQVEFEEDKMVRLEMEREQQKEEVKEDVVLEREEVKEEEQKNDN